MGMFVKPPTEENGGLVSVWEVYYVRQEYEEKLKAARQENVVLKRCLEWYADGVSWQKAVEGWWADTAEDRQMLKEAKMARSRKKQKERVEIVTDAEFLRRWADEEVAGKESMDRFRAIADRLEEQETMADPDLVYLELSPELHEMLLTAIHDYHEMIRTKRHELMKEWLPGNMRMALDRDTADFLGRVSALIKEVERQSPKEDKNDRKGADQST